MYLKRLILKDIRCFQDLELDFTDEHGKPRLWTALLANNGLGKTVILQSIAVALAGSRTAAELMPYPRSWVRWKKEKGVIDLTVAPGRFDEPAPRKEVRIRYWVIGEGRVKIGGEVYEGPRLVEDRETSDWSLIEKTAHSRSARGWFACGYGPFRRIPKGVERESTKPFYDPRSRRFSTLFDESATLGEPRNWLINLDYRALKKRDAASKSIFRRAIEAIDTLLPEASFSRISENREVLFKTDYGEVPIEELSDGYRSVIAWSTDFVMKMVESFPNLKNPLAAEGIVLVDEIDLHIHPEWQRKIVSQLQGQFPRMQFVVSSHSPFVAQSLEADDIVVLKREEDHVIAQMPEITIKGWRADQILTSRLFGLETTRDIDTEALLKEYDNLLFLREKDQIRRAQVKRLKQIEEQLARELPPSPERPDQREWHMEVRQLIEDLGGPRKILIEKKTKK